MAFIKKAKRYAKGVAKRVGRLARKRYMPKGVPNLQNLVKDVKMLKHLVNVEKKRFDVTVSAPINVGQYNGAATGAHCSIITPYPIQGTAQSQRVGNSIKLVSCQFACQFLQQANCVNNMKIRWAIVCRPTNDVNVNASGNLNSFYEVNPFSTVIDYYSNRDPEYFSQFRVIKSGTITLKSDQTTNGQSAVQVKVPLRLNHHLKFNENSSTITTKNQFLLMMTASAGDIVPGQNAPLTGALFQYNVRWYYTDD